MKKKLVTIAIASSLLSATAHNAHADDADTSHNSYKEYIGTGIGATAGALVAGPAGFIVGGVIGNLAGRHQAVEENAGQPPADTVLLAEASTHQTAATTPESSIVDVITHGHPSDRETSVSSVADIEARDPLDIILPAAQLEIFFLSGSTEVETFYKARIQAISKLLHAAPDIGVRMEGYSDRRGEKAENLELASARLESVLKQFIEAGIDAGRIDIKALGEQNFISSPGNLEAYTFDRRVVISLDHAVPNKTSPVAMSNDQQVN